MHVYIIHCTGGPGWLLCDFAKRVYVLLYIPVFVLKQSSYVCIHKTVEKLIRVCVDISI